MPKKKVRFSDYTQQRLKDAGWFPNRNIANKIQYPKQVEIFPIAYEIISEFGNLQIGTEYSMQPGIELATAALWIEPSKAIAHESIESAQEIIGEKVYPIGLVDFDNSSIGAIYVNQIGCVFRLGDTEDFYGNDFDKALQKMLEGIMPIPIEDASW